MSFESPQPHAEGDEPASQPVQPSERTAKNTPADPTRPQQRYTTQATHSPSVDTRVEIERPGPTEAQSCTASVYSISHLNSRFRNGSADTGVEPANPG